MSKPKKPRKSKRQTPAAPEWPMSPADAQAFREHADRWMDGVMQHMGLEQPPAAKTNVVEFRKRTDPDPDR